MFDSEEEIASMKDRLSAKANLADKDKALKLLSSLRFCENALWNTTESLISLANADSAYGDHLTMVHNLDECKKMLRQTAYLIKDELSKARFDPKVEERCFQERHPAMSLLPHPVTGRNEEKCLHCGEYVDKKLEASAKDQPFGPKYAAAADALHNERTARCEHKHWVLKQNPEEGNKPTPWCDACQRHCIP